MLQFPYFPTFCLVRFQSLLFDFVEFRMFSFSVVVSLLLFLLLRFFKYHHHHFAYIRTTLKIISERSVYVAYAILHVLDYRSFHSIVHMLKMIQMYKVCTVHCICTHFTSCQLPKSTKCKFSMRFHINQYFI